MNQELLQEKIDEWEERSQSLLCEIDNNDTVERIMSRGSFYWLYRYFEIGDQVYVSVDLNYVEAEDVIKHLAGKL